MIDYNTMIQQLQQHYDLYTTHNELVITVPNKHEANLVKHKLASYDNNYTYVDTVYEFDDDSLYIGVTRLYIVLGYNVEVCYSKDYSNLEDYIDACDELGHEYY